MRLLKIFIAFLLLAPLSAKAAGFLEWSFGMTREQVQAQTRYSPYYPFKNGDLWSQNGPFQGQRVPISFYFDNDRLVRVMLIAYMGSDIVAARDSARLAVNQLSTDFGGTELPTFNGPATPESVLLAFDNDVPKLAPAQRFQFGAYPMPADRKAWVSVSLLQAGQYMVAVNYAEP